MSFNESTRSNSNYPRMTNSEWANSPMEEEETIDVEIELTLSGFVKTSIMLTPSELRMATKGVPLSDEEIIDGPDESIIRDAIDQQLMESLRDEFPLDDLQVDGWELI